MQATNRKTRSAEIHLYMTRPSHFSEIVTQYEDLNSCPYLRGRRGKRSNLAIFTSAKHHQRVNLSTQCTLQTQDESESRRRWTCLSVSVGKRYRSWWKRENFRYRADRIMAAWQTTKCDFSLVCLSLKWSKKKRQIFKYVAYSTITSIHRHSMG